MYICFLWSQTLELLLRHLVGPLMQLKEEALVEMFTLPAFGGEPSDCVFSVYKEPDMQNLILFGGGLIKD